MSYWHYWFQPLLVIYKLTSDGTKLKIQISLDISAFHLPLVHLPSVVSFNLLSIVVDKSLVALKESLIHLI